MMLKSDDGDEGDAGLQYTAFEYIIAAGGLNTFEEYPYLVADGFCHPNRSDLRCPVKCMNSPPSPSS